MQALPEQRTTSAHTGSQPPPSSPPPPPSSCTQVPLIKPPVLSRRTTPVAPCPDCGGDSVGCSEGMDGDRLPTTHSTLAGGFYSEIDHHDDSAGDSGAKSRLS